MKWLRLLVCATPYVRNYGNACPQTSIGNPSSQMLNFKHPWRHITLNTKHLGVPAYKLRRLQGLLHATAACIYRRRLSKCQFLDSILDTDWAILVLLQYIIEYSPGLLCEVKRIKLSLYIDWPWNVFHRQKLQWPMQSIQRLKFFLTIIESKTVQFFH